MARQGAFDGLDAAMMVHPAGIDLITMPSLAVNEVRVTYTGKARMPRPCRLPVSMRWTRW